MICGQASADRFVVSDKAAAGDAFELVVVDEPGIEQEGASGVVEGVDGIRGESECPRSTAHGPRSSKGQMITASPGDVPHDRDCADFAESDFPTPPGDPDRLDADGDGIACES